MLHAWIPPKRTLRIVHAGRHLVAICSPQHSAPAKAMRQPLQTAGYPPATTVNPMWTVDWQCVLLLATLLLRIQKHDRIPPSTLLVTAAWEQLWPQLEGDYIELGLSPDGIWAMALCTVPAPARGLHTTGFYVNKYQSLLRAPQLLGP